MTTKRGYLCQTTHTWDSCWLCFSLNINKSERLLFIHLSLYLVNVANVHWCLRNNETDAASAQAYPLGPSKRWAGFAQSKQPFQSSWECTIIHLNNRKRLFLALFLFKPYCVSLNTLWIALDSACESAKLYLPVFSHLSGGHPSHKWFDKWKIKAQVWILHIDLMWLGSNEREQIKKRR